MKGSIIATVDSAELAQAVRTASAALQKRSRIEAFRMVHLEAANGELVIFGTDYDLTITARIPAETEACGRIMIEPQALVAACATTTKGGTRTVIEADLEAPPVAAVRVGHNTFKIPALEATTTHPKIEKDAFVLCGLDAVRSALEHTVPFVCQETTRQYLCGVAMHEPKRWTLAFVASDGPMLGRAMVPILDRNASYLGEHLIRTYMVRAMLKTLKAPRGSHATVRINIDDPLVHFTIPGSTVVATVRSPDEPYVDYQRIIPTAWKCDKTIGMQDITSAVTAMKAWCDPGLPALTLHISSGEMRIRPHTKERKPVENVIRTPDDSVVEEIDLCVDADRLMTILRALNTNSVRMLVSDVEKPIRLVSPDIDGLEYVLMPMRR
jgi:DNA polymerase III sliding clamp (beta) subunit (PCNA family)